MWRRPGDYEELDSLSPEPPHSQVLDHCPNFAKILPTANHRGNSGSSSSRNNLSQEIGGSPSTTDNSNEPQLSVDNDVVYTIYGYQFCWTRFILFHILALIPFCGLPHLLAIWVPQIRCWKFRKSPLAYCDYVRLENNLDLLQIIPVQQIIDVESDPTSLPVPMFLFEEIRYKYAQGRFISIRNHHEGRTIRELCSRDYSIDPEHRQAYSDYFGPNEIRIHVKNYWTLFTEEILNPFYLFQIFSITLWSLDDYYYYAACVLTLSAISIGTSLYQTKKQSLSLREIVEKSRPQVVTVKLRSTSSSSDFTATQISPMDLLPSDLLVIENGLKLPCDLLLIEGSCIVNECMLTGESIPVNKVAVDSTDEQKFNENLLKRNILYAGTEVILANGLNEDSPVLATVLAVGFATSKGQLIKSILYPKPIGFKFYKDSMRFVMLLFCCAVFGMLYSVRLYLRRNQDFRTMIFGTLDVITIIVPPSLPMAMTAGTIYSQNRLKKRGIFCVSPPQINVAGKMKLCCFDKTGTLTEDGLTYFGYLNVGVHGGVNEQLKSLMPINLFDKFLQGLATCHSLIAHDNALLGDPLDAEMFRATDWQLMEKSPYLPAPRSVTPRSEIGKSLEHDLPYVIGIYKDFEFTSERQGMSVIVQILGHDNFIMFAKGAPEKIRSNLVDNSIPANFDSVLSRYAMRGYRVLALAYKEFPAKVKLTDLNKKTRDQLEQNLFFLGFIVFENKLKPETEPTIRELKQAALRIVMATGDNILTAVSVARESGIVAADEKVFQLQYDTMGGKLRAQEVKGGSTRRESAVETNAVIVNFDSNNTAFYDHFAMDGASWEAVRKHRPELITKILTRGTVFARFRPEQKSELVLGLQDMDYIVTMCGDGANDCTALKAANIGVSLSQAEASVAAPFTSNRQNIACIKDLALEGRCALVTSFAIFKYMILYSVIQFCTVLILYTYCTTLGNFQFLYIDLIITASIAFSMGLQEPSRELAAKRPSSSLISPNNVIPLLVQIVGCVLMQIGAVLLLTHQRWYPEGELEERCYHNETTRQRITFHGVGSGLADGGYRAERSVVSWENTVVFLTSCFQYLVLGLVYSKGRPFRKPFYTNITFVAIFLSLTTFTLILLLQPPEPLSQFFELKNIFDTSAEENIFRYYLLVFPMVHIVTALVVELGMADRPWLKKAVHLVTRKTRPRNKFKMLDSEFHVDSDWIEFEDGQVTAGQGTSKRRGS